MLSATVQVAGPGGGRGGVQPRHKIARTGKVLSEECETWIKLSQVCNKPVTVRWNTSHDASTAKTESIRDESIPAHRGSRNGERKNLRREIVY